MNRITCLVFLLAISFATVPQADAQYYSLYYPYYYSYYPYYYYYPSYYVLGKRSAEHPNRKITSDQMNGMERGGTQ